MTTVHSFISTSERARFDAISRLLLIARFIHFEIEKEVLNHIFFCKCNEKYCIYIYSTFHHLCNFKTDDTIAFGGMNFLNKAAIIAEEIQKQLQYVRQ